MKKNFDDTTQTEAMFNNFATIEEAQEEPKKADTSTKEPEEAQSIKEDKKEPKKAKKEQQEEPTKEKCNIFSEVNKSTRDYIELKSIITKQSKKEILNNIFGEEIKKTFELSENATEEEMQRAIEKRMKQIEQMKTLFK